MVPSIFVRILPIINHMVNIISINRKGYYIQGIGMLFEFRYGLACYRGHMEHKKAAVSAAFFCSGF